MASHRRGSLTSAPFLTPQYDRLQGWASVRRVRQGILASFVAMPGLVFYNFAPTPFVEISSVLFTAETFIAFLKKIDLTYILAAGAALSFLIFGYLSWLPLMPPGRGEQREKAYSLMRL